MHLISVTMRPHEKIEVDDAEYLDLQRQGLIAEDETPDAEKAEPKTETEVRSAKRN